jgi:hypothetical protein
MKIRAKATKERLDGRKMRSHGSGAPAAVSRFLHAPVNRILHLQGIIGNRDVGGMFGRAAAARREREERSRSAIQLVPEASCEMSTDESKMKTKKVKDAPKSFYGADFNHVFPSLPEGCSLQGLEATETIDTVRDDFRSGAGNTSAGKTIWKLTKENMLHRPDSIWTKAGPKGLGVNPLLRWPAILEQNQIWSYRRSKNDSWHSGPGIVLKATLSGDLKNRASLIVTTTDHGISRSEPYRGPAISMQE